MNWKIKLVILLLCLAVFKVLLIDTILQPQYLKVDTYEYGDTGALRNGNVCVSTSRQLPYWKVKVDVVDDLGTALGSWHPTAKNIKLSEKGGIDIDTVSHEVYHMVEDVIEWYNITDPHMGAYLQGNWTRCVLEVVQHQGDFKFSD